jgi:hypothetical protein
MPSNVCFVCSTEVASIEGLGVVARASCASCKRRARLLAGGSVLGEIIESSGSGPLEGSRLNVVLNPLKIDGHRCWADFAAGGFVVFEEVFASANEFDFWVQHCEPWAGAMRILRARSRRRLEPHEVVELFRGIPTSIRGLDNLQWLQQRWINAVDAAEAVSKHPTIRQANDVHRIIETLPDRETLPADVFDTMVGRLMSLAVSSASTRL